MAGAKYKILVSMTKIKKVFFQIVILFDTFFRWSYEVVYLLDSHTENK